MVFIFIIIFVMIFGRPSYELLQQNSFSRPIFTFRTTSGLETQVMKLSIHLSSFIVEILPPQVEASTSFLLSFTKR